MHSKQPKRVVAKKKLQKRPHIQQCNQGNGSTTSITTTTTPRESQSSPLSFSDPTLSVSIATFGTLSRRRFSSKNTRNDKTKDQLRKIRPEQVSYRSNINLDQRNATVINVSTLQRTGSIEKSSDSQLQSSSSPQTASINALNSKNAKFDIQSSSTSPTTRTHVSTLPHDAHIHSRQQQQKQNKTPQPHSKKSLSDTTAQLPHTMTSTTLKRPESLDKLNDIAKKAPLSAHDLVKQSLPRKLTKVNNDTPLHANLNMSDPLTDSGDAIPFGSDGNDNDKGDLGADGDDDDDGIEITPYELFESIYGFKYRVAIGQHVNRSEIEDLLDVALQVNCPEAVIEAWSIFDPDTYLDETLLSDAIKACGVTKSQIKPAQIPKLNLNIYTTTIFACSLLGSSSLAYSIYTMMGIDSNVLDEPYDDDSVSRLLGLTLNSEILEMNEDNNIVMSLYTDLCNDLSTYYGVPIERIHNNFQKQEDQSATYLKLLDYLQNPDKRYAHRLAQEIIENPYSTLPPRECKEHIKNILVTPKNDPHYDLATPAISALSTSLVLLACIRSGQNLREAEAQKKLALQRSDPSTRAYAPRKNKLDVDSVLTSSSGSTNNNNNNNTSQKNIKKTGKNNNNSEENSNGQSNEKTPTTTVDKPFEDIEQESSAEIDNVIRSVLQRVLYHDTVKVTPSHVALAVYGTYTLSFKYIPTLEKIFQACGYRQLPVVPQTLFALMHVAKEVNSRFHQFMYFDAHFIPPSQVSFHTLAQNLTEIQSTRKLIVEQGKNMMFTQRNTAANTWYHSLDQYTKQMYNTDGGVYGIASRFGHLIFPNLLHVISTIYNVENKKRSATQIWASLLSHGVSEGHSILDGTNSNFTDHNDVNHNNNTYTQTDQISGQNTTHLTLAPNPTNPLNTLNTNQSQSTIFSPTPSSQNDYYSDEKHTVLTPQETKFSVSIQRPIFYTFIQTLSAMRGLPYGLWARSGDAAPALWREALLLSEILSQFTSEPDRYAFSLSIESAMNSNEPEPVLFLAQRILERRGRVRVRLLDNILYSLQPDHLSWSPVPSIRMQKQVNKYRKMVENMNQNNDDGSNTTNTPAMSRRERVVYSNNTPEQLKLAATVSLNQESNNNYHYEDDGNNNNNNNVNDNFFNDHLSHHVDHFFKTHEQGPDGVYTRLKPAHKNKSIKGSDHDAVDMSGSNSNIKKDNNNNNIGTDDHDDDDHDDDDPIPVYIRPEVQQLYLNQTQNDNLSQQLPIQSTGISIITNLISTAMTEPIEYSLHQTRKKLGLSSEYYNDKSFATELTNLEQLKHRITEFESEDEPDFEALRFLRKQAELLDDTGLGNGIPLNGKKTTLLSTLDQSNVDYRGNKAIAETMYDFTHALNGLQNENYKEKLKLANPRAISSSSVRSFIRALSGSGNALFAQGIVMELIGGEYGLGEFPTSESLPSHLHHLAPKPTTPFGVRYNPNILIKSKIKDDNSHDSNNDNVNVKKSKVLFRRDGTRINDEKATHIEPKNSQKSLLIPNNIIEQMSTHKDVPQLNKFIEEVKYSYLYTLDFETIPESSLIARPITKHDHNNYINSTAYHPHVQKMASNDMATLVSSTLFATAISPITHNQPADFPPSNVIKTLGQDNHINRVLLDLSTQFDPKRENTPLKTSSPYQITPQQRRETKIALSNLLLWSLSQTGFKPLQMTFLGHIAALINIAQISGHPSIISTLAQHTNGGTLEQRLEWFGLRNKDKTIDQQIADDLAVIMKSVNAAQANVIDNSTSGQNGSDLIGNDETSFSHGDKARVDNNDDGGGDDHDDEGKENNQNDDGTTSSSGGGRKRGRRRFKPPFSFTFVHDMQKLEGKLSSRTRYRSFVQLCPENDIGFGKISDMHHRSQLHHVYLLSLEAILKGAILVGNEDQTDANLSDSAAMYPFSGNDKDNYINSSKQYINAVKTEHGANCLQLYNLAKKRFNWSDLTTTLGVTNNNAIKGHNVVVDDRSKNTKSILLKRKTPSKDAQQSASSMQMGSFESFDQFIESLTPAPSIYTSNGYNDIKINSANSTSATELPISIDQHVVDYYKDYLQHNNDVDERNDVLQKINNNSFLMDFRQMSRSHATIAFMHSIHQLYTLRQTIGYGQNIDGKKQSILLLLPRNDSQHAFSETPLISTSCTSEFVSESNHFESLFNENGQGSITISKLTTSEQHKVDLFNVIVE